MASGTRYHGVKGDNTVLQNTVRGPNWDKTDWKITETKVDNPESYHNYAAGSLNNRYAHLRNNSYMYVSYYLFFCGNSGYRSEIPSGIVTVARHCLRQFIHIKWISALRLAMSYICQRPLTMPV